jgi:FkbM family methyltransferase
MSVSVLEVEKDGHKFRYARINQHCDWRVKTLFTKEPDTIAWIESMQPGETLIDVGANIGIYTIYAGVRGVNVWAFEPEAQNYAILCTNIFANELNNTLAYCAALSDYEAKMGRLYLSGYLPGGSCHSFGEAVDHNLTVSDRKFVQGSIAFPLDSAYINAQYVKIDVDGFEHKVVKGGEKTIKAAKSVLIEINMNLPEHRDLIDLMLEWGFKYDPAQAEGARRKEGSFKDCGNIIFTK